MLRYAGYAYDARSGLHCLSKRCCDPTTAQLLTKDPAKAHGEESPYQYCGGDPVGKVDPSGERVAPLTAMTYGQRDRIRGLALAWVNRSVPYLYGAKYFHHYKLKDKHQGGKTVDAYHRLDCSGFVQRILNEAGVRGIPSIKSSVNSAWKSSSFYDFAPKKGRSNTQYFDAVTRTPYQIGDIPYSSGHVAIVISNGKDPEIAGCTPWPGPNGWKDGTKKTRLSKRWSSWRPTRAGRYIVAYSHNVIP